MSIVLSREFKNYRKLALEWYGLTDEEMLEMDVHHNPHRSQGGRNIPEHLYVYHNTLHNAVHANDFALWSRVGGEKSMKKLHAEKTEDGRSVNAIKLGKRGAEKTHSIKDELGRSLHNLKLHSKTDPLGRSLIALKMMEKRDAIKTSNGKSLFCSEIAKKLNAQKWEDPEHLELGQQNPGNLVKMQKARGLPHRPENRRRVYPPDPTV